MICSWSVLAFFRAMQSLSTDWHMTCSVSHLGEGGGQVLVGLEESVCVEERGGLKVGLATAIKVVCIGVCVCLLKKKVW